MVWLIDSLLDLAKARSVYISQAIEVLLNCLFYPFERVLYWMGAIIGLILNCITGIIDSIWNIFTIIYDFTGNLLATFLPHTLLLIVLTGLTIVFLFRLYHFIKNVSIIGNSI